MSITRAAIILAAGLAGGSAAAQPPVPPVLESLAALKMDGAHGLGEPGLDRPILGIDRAALAWAMSDFYPPASLRAHEEGDAKVAACVNEQGRVVKTGLLSSSGFPRLDQAALTMMAALPMRPATLNGSRVAFCGFALTVSWKMPDSAPATGEKPAAKP